MNPIHTHSANRSVSAPLSAPDAIQTPHHTPLTDRLLPHRDPRVIDERDHRRRDGRGGGRAEDERECTVHADHVVRSATIKDMSKCMRKTKFEIDPKDEVDIKSFDGREKR